MKFLKRALVASVAALALAVGPVVSAEAASLTFDVTKLSADNMVVSNDNCKYFNVYLKYTKKNVDYWTVDSEIAGRYGYTTEAYFGSYKSPSTKDRNMICPVWTDSASIESVHQKLTSKTMTLGTRLLITPKGYFYVRGKTYASLSSKRSGSTVTLTSSTKVYNPECYGKTSYNPKVKFPGQVRQQVEDAEDCHREEGQGRLQGEVEEQAVLPRHLQPGQLGHGSDFEVGQALTRRKAPSQRTNW
jgi:hypothetical protein